jgi:ATP-dependent HslUV protease ATP-binding subunit HslU
VLFIAAGAFHVSKPSDLIPELQGRFPIRVELEPLRLEDLVRILTEPRNALVGQYQALLAADGVSVAFTEEAIHEMARFAMQVNAATENIGARRLATILETVLEELSFEAGESGPRAVTIDADEVRRRLSAVAANQDLSRYIL